MRQARADTLAAVSNPPAPASTPASVPAGAASGRRPIEIAPSVLPVDLAKLGEAVVTVLPATRGENGTEIPNRLITKTQDWWPGRIDGLLSDENPGELPADLSKVLALRGA